MKAALSAQRLLRNGISRHGASCLCNYCRPTVHQIKVRLERAVSEDDMAMIARCRAALTGDRQALGSLYAALEMERLMGGAP